jgi:hypothetical protein
LGFQIESLGFRIESFGVPDRKLGHINSAVRCFAFRFAACFALKERYDAVLP